MAAVDTADALTEALTRDDFDVAIVDVRLPPTFTTEGIETVVRARAMRPNLPVLILSQYVEPLYARELLAAGRGSVGYLLKDRVADVDGFLAAVRQQTVHACRLAVGAIVTMAREATSGRQTHRSSTQIRTGARRRVFSTHSAHRRQNLFGPPPLESVPASKVREIFTKLTNGHAASVNPAMR